MDVLTLYYTAPPGTRSETISIDVDAISFIEIKPDPSTDLIEFFFVVASLGMRRVYDKNTNECRFMLSVADAFATKTGE